MQLKVLKTVFNNYVLAVVIISIISLIVLDYFGCISFKLFFTSCLDTFLGLENKKHFLDKVPFLVTILNNKIETITYIERKVYFIIGIKKSLLIIFYAIDLVIQYLDLIFFNLNTWMHENYQHYWSVVIVNLYDTRPLKFFWLDLWSEPFFRVILFPASVLILLFIIWFFVFLNRAKR
jgi:hypothetical protein